MPRPRNKNYPNEKCEFEGPDNHKPYVPFMSALKSVAPDDKENVFKQNSHDDSKETNVKPALNRDRFKVPNPRSGLFRFVWHAKGSFKQIWKLDNKHWGAFASKLGPGFAEGPTNKAATEIMRQQTILSWFHISHFRRSIPSFPKHMRETTYGDFGKTKSNQNVQLKHPPPWGLGP